MSAQKYFLANLNYDAVCQPPFNNNPQVIAAQVRNGTRIQILEGKDLLMWNIKLEAKRLQLQNRNLSLVTVVTDQVWSSRAMRSKRKRFISLAENANIINQNIE